MAADNLDRSVIAVISYRLNDQGSIPDKSREPSDYPGRKQKVTACGVIRDEVQRLYRGILYSGVPKGGFGVFKTPPPRNSEDTGGDLHRTTKKNRRLDFLL